MSAKINMAVLLLGAFLLLVAASVAIYYNWDEYQAGRRSRELLAGVQAVSAGFEANGSGQAAVMAAAPSQPGVTYPVLGILSVPGLELTLPVLEECSDRLLDVSVCRYSGDTGGRMIISGHNYKTHFKRIPSMAVGDPLWFEDLSGQRTDYKVTATEEIDGKDRAGLEEGEWDLTLFTCNFDGSRRILIRCEEI